MFLRSYKLIDLYSRLKNYIDSNYIFAIIEEDDNITNIGFANQPERISIFKDSSEESLFVKISQNITEHLSDSNGKIFCVSTLDELNSVKAGIDVILNMQYNSINSYTTKPFIDKKESIPIEKKNNEKDIRNVRTIRKFFKRR